jgi:hypothetical protein
LYGLHGLQLSAGNRIEETPPSKSGSVVGEIAGQQDYDFSIEYRAGSTMGHVDYLSRNLIDTIWVVKAPKPLCVVNSETYATISEAMSFAKVQGITVTTRCATALLQQKTSHTSALCRLVRAYAQ